MEIFGVKEVYARRETIAVPVATVPTEVAGLPRKAVVEYFRQKDSLQIENLDLQAITGFVHPAGNHVIVESGRIFGLADP